jgi:hypothetical protein
MLLEHPRAGDIWKPALEELPAVLDAIERLVASLKHS